MGTSTPTGPIDAARRALERERRQLREEVDAFTAFGERVVELEATQPRAGRRQTRIAASSSTALQSVRDAYAETVMDVSHYELAYDESLGDHMAGELGEEVAAAVTSSQSLHPPLKRSLITTINEAIRTRKRVLALIDGEEERLDEAERTVVDTIERIDSILDQPIDRMEFNSLRLTRERLLDLRAECDDLVDERQDFLEQQRRELPDPMTGLAEYLYQYCETTFPLLAVYARLADVIDRSIERTERRLSEAS